MTVEMVARMRNPGSIAFGTPLRCRVGAKMMGALNHGGVEGRPTERQRR